LAHGYETRFFRYVGWPRRRRAVFQACEARFLPTSLRRSYFCAAPGRGPKLPSAVQFAIRRERARSPSSVLHRNAMTEANHVLVGIADVYFADPPRFVRRTVNHVGAESRN